MDKHVIEAMGKAKVTIIDGKVVEVGEPLIDYCPIFHKHRGIEKLDEKSIKENIEFRINDFGMCSAERKVKMKDFLSFGVSETLSTLLDEKLIDCAIMVCEGCGTIIVTDGELAQGVGGRVSGLAKTTPIPEVIEKIGEKNVLDSKTAEINQIKGIELANSQGFEKIAVTITNPNDGKTIRELEKKYNEKDKSLAIYIFGVHVTGVDSQEAKKLFDCCDVVTACASKPIRDIGDKIATKKVGESIPIYGATEIGKEFIELRVEKIGGMKPKKDPKVPSPLI